MVSVCCCVWYVFCPIAYSHQLKVNQLGQHSANTIMQQQVNPKYVNADIAAILNTSMAWGAGPLKGAVCMVTSPLPVNLKLFTLYVCMCV